MFGVIGSSHGSHGELVLNGMLTCLIAWKFDCDRYWVCENWLSSEKKERIFFKLNHRPNFEWHTIRQTLQNECS